MQGSRAQPEMKKIQERYKDDRQRMNQEMMKFYQENKVNPAGLLPAAAAAAPVLHRRSSTCCASDAFTGGHRGQRELPASSPTSRSQLTDDPVVLGVR